MRKYEIIVRITENNKLLQEKEVLSWHEHGHGTLFASEADVLRYPGLDIFLHQRRVLKNGHEVILSRYEYGVLSLMAQHPGKLFTKEQIFEAVWHEDSESYLRAVSSTINRIRRKIEDDKDHPRYIRTISNLGYQFMPTEKS